jgi:hypothetical protein
MESPFLSTNECEPAKAQEAKPNNSSNPASNHNEDTQVENEPTSDKFIPSLKEGIYNLITNTA